VNPKVGLVEETKWGGKDGKTANNNGAHHICVGTRQTETLWKLLNNTGWGKEWDSAVERGYLDLSTMHAQANYWGENATEQWTIT
jgi:hypothetical protein